MKQLNFLSCQGPESYNHVIFYIIIQSNEVQISINLGLQFLTPRYIFFPPTDCQLQLFCFCGPHQEASHCSTCLFNFFAAGHTLASCLLTKVHQSLRVRGTSQAPYCGVISGERALILQTGLIPFRKGLSFCLGRDYPLRYEELHIPSRANAVRFRHFQLNWY